MLYRPAIVHRVRVTCAALDIPYQAALVKDDDAFMATQPALDASRWVRRATWSCCRSLDAR
jgi:hypothetical protein